MALVFIAYPLAIYLSLCLLPRGRASVGILLAAAALGLVWFTNDPSTDDGFARLLVTIGVFPVALAALAQGLRGMIPATSPAWLWPALVAGIGLSGVVVFFMLL